MWNYIVQCLSCWFPTIQTITEGQNKVLLIPEAVSLKYMSQYGKKVLYFSFSCSVMVLVLSSRVMTMAMQNNEIFLLTQANPKTIPMLPNKQYYPHYITFHNITWQSQYRQDNASWSLSIEIMSLLPRQTNNIKLQQNRTAQHWGRLAPSLYQTCNKSFWYK